LQDAGITPQLSSQDRDHIMSTFRKAANQEDLLKSVTPTTQASDPMDLVQPSSDRPAEPQVAPQEKGLSDKEAMPAKEENLPIPVAFEIQDTDDSSKQAWATITSPMDEFPIPVWSEPGHEHEDTDKQVVSQAWQPDTLPIPVEPDGRRHSRTGSTTSVSSSTASKSQPPSVPALTRGKKPSLMSRMKFKLISSKDDFVALVQMGGLYSIKYALDKGADPNTMNWEGQTALMVAVSYGHEDVVSLLLEYGAKPDKITNHGETALGTAALRGLDDIAQLLLVHGTDPDGAKNLGKTALSQAAITGSLSMAKLLLEWGANANSLSSNGSTALACAADNGRLQTAQLLLERGALVDKCAYPRRTPLFKAVQRGNVEMVELLLSFGADPNRQDVHNQSPMSLAISLDRAEIVSIFYQHGFEFGADATDATYKPTLPPRRDLRASAVFQYY
jgi:ankyrin repeat protein